MDYRYNAFISYRHSEEDMEVAEHIQTALERYRIPHSVRKRLGVEGPLNIFRDKYDLPVTDSLNDTIGVAIRESEYLIVICSVHTKDSIWVDKEIELFLKTHSRKNIFTVLVSGEPQEVIPEVLLYEEAEEETADGETVKIKRALEPLSCDYRKGIKKSKKTELPRLAAGLLGCSYEELIRRKQQYRFRMFATVAVIALCAVSALAVYMYWSSTTIKKNYDKALFNKSQYLAEESIRVKDEDKELAVQLALEGLPSEDNDMPYNPHTQYALGIAVDAYNYPNSNQFEVAKTLSVDKRKIYSMASNQEGSMVAGVTNSDEVYVWDVDTGDVLFQKKIDKECSNIPQLPFNNL